MPSDIALQLLYYSLVLLAWLVPALATVRATLMAPGAVLRLCHCQKGIFHALLDEVRRADRELLDFQKLLLGSPTVTGLAKLLLC